MDLGHGEIPIEGYLSCDWHDREIERVWKKTWQIACREEDIPNEGDVHVYQVSNMSALIVRVAPDEIKAYPNACLHRANLLRSADGNVREIRCPFHGFCWRLDGSLVEIPSQWDFPHLDEAALSLPEFKVSRWEGFVFLNMNPSAISLEEYLGDMIADVNNIANPQFSRRWKNVAGRKPVRCNWKVALEAFIEVLHVSYVHPHALLWGADTNSQYNTYPGQRHWNRMVVPGLVPSPNYETDYEEQDIIDSMFDGFKLDGSMEVPQVAESSTARATFADFYRHQLLNFMGVDGSEISDAQLLDTIEWFIFPNSLLIGGVMQSMLFRFFPYKKDPDSCIIDITWLPPVGGDAPIPPAGKLVELDFDDQWATVSEFGGAGVFLDQDEVCMPKVQQGLHSTVMDGLKPGLYQESRLRHFHQTLDEYMQG